MNRYKIISFDLQGTLSEASFSDNFWMQLLPKEYARSFKITLREAKTELAERFSKMGRYDRRYYDHEYWLNICQSSLSLTQILAESGARPQLVPGAEKALEEIGKAYPMIVFSSTTKAFIHMELGALANKFTAVFSSFDDLGLAGKPEKAFRQVAVRMGEEPASFIHVGDDPLMDVANAEKAGWNAFYWQGDYGPLLEELGLS